MSWSFLFVSIVVGAFVYYGPTPANPDYTAQANASRACFEEFNLDGSYHTTTKEFWCKGILHGAYINMEINTLRQVEPKMRDNATASKQKENNKK